MGISETYRILVLGDFHYGESYTGEGEKALKDYGYEHSTRHLKSFIDSCDSFILNLETPLVDPNEAPPPFKKTYLHWGDPQNTVNQLKALNVDAVSLANNHTLDRGYKGLEKTFQVLDDAGVAWFGAGRDLHEARKPYRLALPERIGGGEVHFHGTYQYSTSNEKYGSYANEESPGCAPLGISTVANPRTESTPEDSLQVAFPHWGGNYKWRGNLQYRLAHRLLNKDYDLVLGHGGHAMQEVLRKQQRWVVYGIGNGNFLSEGRWHRFEVENGILPFSFWSVLEVCLHDDGSRRLQLKLYPVYSNNRETNYQPGPVTAEDFERVISALHGRPRRPWRFDNPAKSTGRDDLGSYLALDLGEWEAGQRPARLEGALEGGDPGDWPLRSAAAEIEDSVLGLDKHLGASMLALAATAEGGTATWLTWRTALIECGGKRMLAHGYGAHESALGTAIVKDKVLTADLLERRGVATPKTFVVESAEEALNVASSMDGPIVVKPRNGVKSRGVSTGLVEEGEIREAFSRARQVSAEVIAQQHVEGVEELRVMAGPDTAVAVNGRLLPHVIGDGGSTIEQLISDKNLQRTLNPSLWRRPIPVDPLTLRHLRRQGMDLEFTPGAGQKVVVRDIAGLSVGGDTFQNLKGTDQQLKATASEAISAIPGLGWGGVDLLIEKVTNTPYVLEINDDAAYGAALFPAYGEPRDVGTEVWRLRSAHTTPEETGEPRITAVNPERTPIVRGNKPAGRNGRVAFSALFQDSLRRQAYSIEPKSRRVIYVSTDSGEGVWSTRNGLTAADRSVVQRLLLNHSRVFRVLDHENIPRPRGHHISSTAELGQFVVGRVKKVLLLPHSAPWGSAHTRVVAEEDVSATTVSKRTWVQTRPIGRRVRVLATREKAWVVTAHSSQARLSAEHIYLASRLAVRAVRAVPELRWAAVDVLIRPRLLAKGDREGLLVEGLSITPSYSPQDQIRAGDFDQFCAEVLIQKV